MRTNVMRLTLCALLSALSVSAQAQQPTMGFKVGWLRTASSPAPESFRRELRALGYIEGKNIAIEYRSAEDKPARLPVLAEELVRLRVDVIVTSSTSAALAAKNATRIIPVVLLGVTDPIAAGLIDSLARPGGNITGFTTIAEVLAGKRLELLKETAANISRVAFLWNPTDAASAQQWKESLHPARELGLQLYSMQVSSADKYEVAFKDAMKAHVVALAVPQDALAASRRQLIARLAAKHRLPAVYPRVDFVASGGLMSYGADPDESYKRVAAMVDKILKGTKPADIPVEQPTKFELAVNLKTAKTLGITIPPMVLTRATKVIK